MCTLFSSRKTRQNEAQLQVADSSVMVPGTLKSPEKEDPLVAKGQSQQANSDANKSTDLLLQKSQQSTKSDVSSKQQSSEPSNLSASQTSKVSGVTSESAQPESHHGPSNDILPGMCVSIVSYASLMETMQEFILKGLVLFLVDLITGTKSLIFKSPHSKYNYSYNP